MFSRSIGNADLHALDAYASQGEPYGTVRGQYTVHLNDDGTTALYYTGA